MPPPGPSPNPIVTGYYYLTTYIYVAGLGTAARREVFVGNHHALQITVGNFQTV